MDFQIQEQGSTSVVAITGSIDALNANDLTVFLNAQAGKGKTRMVADLSGVDFMSSAGLRSILAVLRDLRTQGGDLRLAATPPEVEKTLKLTGFTSILKTFPTVDAAVASFLA